MALAELGLDGDQGRAVRCQPTVEFRGRVGDWVADIRRLRDEGETTLFVAATPGRAERTIELLKEYDVFAAPVERAEDARYAAVLVAVGGLSRGFRLPDAHFQIYAEADVFEEARHAPERHRARRRRPKRFSRTSAISRPAISSCTSITASAPSPA